MVQDRSNGNAFEFATVAILRAKQLLRGCIPRMPGTDRATTMARREVAAGKIVRIANAEPVLKS